MRTAAEILGEHKYYTNILQKLWTDEEAIKAINKAMEECIDKCADMADKSLHKTLAQSILKLKDQIS